MSLRKWWCGLDPLWRGAIKTAVKAGTGVIIANIVDPLNQLYTAQWFVHILIVVAAVIAVNEAGYWNEWAQKVDDENSST